MCDHEDNSGAPLSFSRFVSLLQQPPFELCESELEFLTPDEYEAAFNEAWQLYFRPVTYHIAGITRDYDNAVDLAQEVFANVYKTRSSFEKAYIYRAAKRTRPTRQCGRPDADVSWKPSGRVSGGVITKMSPPRQTPDPCKTRRSSKARGRRPSAGPSRGCRKSFACP